MSGNLFFALIVGFIVVVFIYAIYWTIFVQPRLRRQLQAEATQRGWTYTPGKSLVVAKSANGHLISPQETISENLQGKSQGIGWEIDVISVVSDAPQRVTYRNGESHTETRRVTHNIAWHSEEVRIEHGSVLLFMQPLGWDQSGSVGGLLKAGVQAFHSSVIYDMMRETYHIGNTPVQLNAPELETKFKVEVSDLGALQLALTSEVRDFLVKNRPPSEAVIQIGDNAVDVFVPNEGQAYKIEKLDALASYGVQLAQVVAAGQSAAAATDPPDAKAS